MRIMWIVIVIVLQRKHLTNWDHGLLILDVPFCLTCCNWKASGVDGLIDNIVTYNCG